MSELAIRLINEAYEKKSEFWDLGNCGLREIPKEMVKLKDTLQHLNLGSWYSISDHHNKSVNNLERNIFADNKQSLFLLSELPYLKSLYLSNTTIGETGAEYISVLSSLTSLDISGGLRLE